MTTTEIGSLDVRLSQDGIQDWKQTVDHLTRDRLPAVEVALAHYLGIQEAISPRTP